MTGALRDRLSTRIVSGKLVGDKGYSGDENNEECMGCLKRDLQMFGIKNEG